MILVKEPPPPELLAAYKIKDEDLEKAWVEHAEGLILRERDLRHADFGGSKLYRADFRGANLSFTKLRRATLSKARFELFEREGKMDLPTRLTEADLDLANLRGANLRQAKLHRAGLYFAKLHGAGLDFAELRGADLRSAKLHGANLSNAGLHGANLTFAEFHGANLTVARLYGADLTRAKLHGAKLTNKATLSGAIMKEAEFLACDMRHADIGGADFTGATMKRCDLRGATDNVLDKDGWTRIKGVLKRERWASPKTLQDVLGKLDKAAMRKTEFPRELKTISDCLVSNNSQWAKNEGCSEDPEGTKAFEMSLIDDWVQLACDDSWVAKAMARRAQLYAKQRATPFPGSRLAHGLVNTHKQAIAGEKDCDGVKELDETTMNELREIVEQSQSQDRNGN